MKVLKSIIIISFTILLGIYIGNYIYKKYKKDNSESVFNEKKDIYLLQYGVYSSEDTMKEAGSNISDYFYYKDDKGYHIIIGITYNKDNLDKIRDAFDIEGNIYLKEVEVSNNEFKENLKQYDNLIENTNDKKSIVNAEIQILNKYEELVLNE